MRDIYYFKYKNKLSMVKFLNSKIKKYCFDKANVVVTTIVVT